MVIKVCVGSSCHLKGAEKVIKKFQEIMDIDKNITIELEACFCQDRCKEGVVVKIDEKIYTKVVEDDVIKLIKKHQRGVK